MPNTNRFFFFYLNSDYLVRQRNRCLCSKMHKIDKVTLILASDDMR